MRILRQHIQRRLGPPTHKIQIALDRRINLVGVRRAVRHFVVPIHIGRECHIAKLGKLFGPVLGIIVQAPPFRKNQHPRPRALNAVVINQQSFKMRIPLPIIYRSLHNFTPWRGKGMKINRNNHLSFQTLFLRYVSLICPVRFCRIPQPPRRGRKLMDHKS